MELRPVLHYWVLWEDCWCKEDLSTSFGDTDPIQIEPTPNRAQILYKPTKLRQIPEWSHKQELIWLGKKSIEKGN